MQRTYLAPLALFAALALGACTYPDGSPNPTATGATVGALGGAAAGNLLTGDSRGTLVGGAIGAGAGALVGQQQQRQEQAARCYTYQPPYC